MTVAISCGEPAGIGPEVAAKAWAALKDEVPLLWIGDPRHLPEGTAWQAVEGPEAAASVCPRALPVLARDFGSHATPGTANPAHAAGVIEAIEAGVALAQGGRASAVCTAPIHKKALADGHLPVVSPIALDADDQAYNTNADVAAAAVANSLRARRLIFMSDVPGLLADPQDPSTLITTLKVSEVEELKRKGVIAGGMIPKVDSAVKALKEGVRRVHFIDGRVPHALLLEVFTDKGIGTEIVHG